MLKRLFSGWRLFFLVGGMTFIAFAMVAFTFALLLDVAPFVSSSPENVVMSLNANLVILLILALLVGYRIFAVFRGALRAVAAENCMPGSHCCLAWWQRRRVSCS